jgi:8-amino-7-oxononanoate synthase
MSAFETEIAAENIEKMTPEQKRELAKRLLKQRADASLAASAKTPMGPGGADAAISIAEPDFSTHPGYIKVKTQRQLAETFGVEIPYFKKLEGIGRARSVIDGAEYDNYASTNYLDLCGHPAVTAAGAAALEQYGTSVQSSRIAGGECPLHQELERDISDLLGTEDCIVFLSGFLANITTIGYLFGPKDLIVHDALMHNSAVQGVLLSHAKRMTFPHNDYEALDRLLAEHRRSYERVLVITEGMFSMDGDYPDVPKFIEVKNRHKAYLMVDEAHSIGVVGERGLGVKERYGIATKDVEIWMGSLSNALASCGGYIAGSKELVENLKYSAPGFIYTVGLPPASTAASIVALRLMKEEPWRVKTLHERAGLFRDLARERGLNTGQSAGLSVIPVITGSSLLALMIANAMVHEGINVQPAIAPAVEEQGARLRFFLSCGHTEDQVRRAVDSVAGHMKRMSGK